MTTYRLVIEYDGTDFNGWQVQPGQRTVQGVLEEGLSTILRQKTRIQGAGRTDAGVHAMGQAASFKTDVEITEDRLCKGLTALGRPDIAVVQAHPVPDAFNARYDSCGKYYRYTVFNRNVPSPLFKRQSFFVPLSIDVEKMRVAGKQLEGEHDFAGFRAADCERETTVRKLDSVSVEAKNGLIQIHVKGTAFLKNMVRIIAGTLVDIGRGRLAEDTILTVLATGDRTKGGQTAPAQGLTLMEVFYPEGWIRKR